MNLLISQQQQQAQTSLREEEFNIHAIMLKIHGFHSPTSNSYLQYEMPLVIGHFAAKVRWIFKKKENSYFIDFKPMLVNHVTSYLRIQSQRQLVDVLRVMNGYNKAKNCRFKYMVDENNYVSLYSMFDAKFTVPPLNNLFNLLYTSAKELNKTILSLLHSIRPHIGEQIPLLPLNNSNEIIPGSSFAQKSCSFLMLMAYNQGIRNFIRQNQANDPRQPSTVVIKQIDLIKEKAVANISQAFTLIGLVDIKVVKTQKLIRKTKNDYEEWLKMRKMPKNKGSGPKNVYGIKILKELRESESEGQGAHCDILLGKFRVILNLSLHNEVNRLLQESSSSIVCVQKEMELAKKVCRYPNKQTSKNSFQNQLCFIMYIKDRSCEFISTYYWQLEKERETMSSIIMDFYPRTLTETIGEEGHLLSMQSKLLLLQRLVEAISWLADNHICHRDIKPSNVMLSVNDIPKLVDFGSCCPVYSRKHFQVKQIRLLGTPGYYCPYSQCPPEIVQRMTRLNYEQHLLFDAYSLGVLMLQILTEQIVSIIPNLGGLLRYISGKCKQTDPEQRITYEELIFLLEKFVDYLQRHYSQPRIF